MYHIQITIFDETNNTMLCDVLASCTNLQNVPRTLKTLLKTEPVLSVTNGSPHAPLTLHADADETPHQQRQRVLVSLKSNTRLVNLSRRNQSYVEPLGHMLDHPVILHKHEALLSYLNTLPKDIPGIDTIRAEAHRKWFAWYDRAISHGVFADWLHDSSLTVRQWHAEYLMARFAAHDFAGRTLRVEVQRYRAALLASRIKVEIFDAKMTTFRAKLDKLQGPVT
jgi:hypothetical protein